MLCPYCHVEYTTERPCFCHVPAERQKESATELRARAPENIAWNAHRGARLD